MWRELANERLSAVSNDVRDAADGARKAGVTWASLEATAESDRLAGDLRGRGFVALPLE